MKANEFVKKFGFKSTKYWIDHFNSVNTLPDEFINIEFLGNLKRIVESHELVEKLGGLERVKKAIDGKHIGYTHFYLHTNDHYVFLDHYIDFIPDHATHIGMFNKAIADVESCMEGV